MVVKHEKLPLDRVARRLEEVDESVRRDAHKAAMLFVPLLVAFAVSCVLVPPVGMIGGLLTGGFYWTKRGKLGRARAKVDFARELHGLLEDELHPRKAVMLDFDLRHYDETVKRVWAGRSSAGNAKYKYSDKWLHYRAVLADGTRVEVVRQAGVKTKKGHVVKEKRRLLLSLTPHPGRYAMERLKDERLGRRLRARLSAAVGAFHNDPEEFHARVDGGGGGTLRIKATQEDAPILAGEVVAIVEEVVRFLQELRGPGARAA
ncbi:MAG: hypothetical protein KIT58_17975 [Planctomycetota bacterium]|nr:hypothetical protein [Planctomycetota bacterium]